MKTHKDLNAWKDSLEFVAEIYAATKTFPKEETFCLIQQLRRAAISIPSNISEGAARDQKREFIRFLRISMGSLTEVETQVIIAEKLNYLNSQDCGTLLGKANKIRSQVTGLIKSIDKSLEQRMR